MAHGQFSVTSVNPNDTHGGGGCVCDPRKQVDCHPPFIVCYANDMEDPRSPHVVICHNCIDRMHMMVHDGEALVSGERHTVTQPAEVNPPERGESPVVEYPDPESDFLAE